MLTGASSITSGKALVKGYDVVKDMDTVRSMLGYCPQFDALDPLLTPREHLEFYARLRNIHSNKLSQVLCVHSVHHHLILYSKFTLNLLKTCESCIEETFTGIFKLQHFIFNKHKAANIL